MIQLNKLVYNGFNIAANTHLSLDLISHRIYVDTDPSF